MEKGKSKNLHSSDEGMGSLNGLQESRSGERGKHASSDAQWDSLHQIDSPLRSLEMMQVLQALQVGGLVDWSLGCPFSTRSKGADNSVDRSRAVRCQRRAAEPTVMGVDGVFYRIAMWEAKPYLCSPSIFAYKVFDPLASSMTPLTGRSFLGKWRHPHTRLAINLRK